MQSISTRFKKKQKQHPFLGAIPIFMMALLKTDKPRQIRAHFRKCIPKDDYDLKEKEQIIKDILGRYPIEND